MAAARIALALLACALTAQAVLSADLSNAPKLASFSSPYKLNRQYVAGLSSGGFAAVQYHVAFSSQLSGAAVFAAGPFYCAQGQITTAELTCMYAMSAVPLSSLESTASQLASAGSIDALSNLKGQPVWLFHGSSDSTVHAPVNDALAQMYEDFGTNLVYNNATDANHAWISPLGVGSCTESQSPYIDNCGFDAENDLLTHLYGKAPKAAASSTSGQVLQINQDDYAQKLFSQDASAYSMDSTGYVYVPTACANGQQCDIFVVLHGCEQGYSTVQDALIQQANLNEYADTNNFIVVYPQVVADSSMGNANGCWDWWSYTGTAGDNKYVTKQGPQMAIVNAIVAGLGFSPKEKAIALE